MKYLLDTDCCIFLINSRSPALLDKIKQERYGDVGISSISFAELFYSAHSSSDSERNCVALMHFASSLVVENFDDNAAIEYGEIKSELDKSDNPVGAFDCLIAAHAKCLGSTIISSNAQVFQRIPGVMVEDWCH